MLSVINLDSLCKGFTGIKSLCHADRGSYIHVANSMKFIPKTPYVNFKTSNLAQTLSIDSTIIFYFLTFSRHHYILLCL